MKKLALIAVPALMLAACSIDPRAYETDPVSVDTPDGVVTCQLYTQKIVQWDRSIDRPAKMSVKAADDVCQKEGLRQRDAK